MAVDEMFEPITKRICTQWQNIYYCPACNKEIHTWSTRGKWDKERNATAIPFVPVAREFFHRDTAKTCILGQPELARPQEEI